MTLVSGPTSDKFVYFSEKMDWPHAKAHCESEGMWLATLDNEADLIEARRVIGEARLEELVLDYETQTWIGLYAKEAMDASRTWHWVEDDSFNGFTNWWQGNAFEGPEPNNCWRGELHPGTGCIRGMPNEQCTEMSLEGTWND